MIEFWTVLPLSTYSLPTFGLITDKVAGLEEQTVSLETVNAGGIGSKFTGKVYTLPLRPIAARATICRNVQQIIGIADTPMHQGQSAIGSGEYDAMMAHTNHMQRINHDDAGEIIGCSSCRGCQEAPALLLMEMLP